MKQHSENLAPESSPAVVTVSKAVGGRSSDLARIVAWTVESVLACDARRVHVKVKRAGKAVAFGVEHRGRMVTFKQKGRAVSYARANRVGEMSKLSGPPEPGVKGWAYDGIPFSALPGCEYLISLTIGSDRTVYPVTLRYRKTVPIEIAGPVEELVAITAHEAFHCFQYMNSLPRSEVDCDRMAIETLSRFRKMNSTSGLPAVGA